MIFSDKVLRLEVLSKEGTSRTPSVKFDSTQGILEIKGRSNPELAMVFYEPLIDWLEEYAKAPGEKTVVNIQLEYFNSSSSKCILDAIKILEGIYKAKHQVVINWYYEQDDEIILEAGEDYKFLTSTPFKIIEIVE
ncbi:MAG TPA: DUF1987 domain-containing protein [Bacteroides sp.]|nr:DUF1987 domain-containing protein [Bacteroides sp.]